MDLINILQRLNAISEESKKKPDADGDGVPDWADKKPGADDNEDKKKAYKEDHRPGDPQEDPGEYDREGAMAKDQLRVINDAAKELYNLLHAEENLPEWVQKKIILAMDYIDTARDYMKSTKYDEAEEKTSAGGTITRTDTGLKHYALPMPNGDYGDNDIPKRLNTGDAAKKTESLNTYKLADVMGVDAQRLRAAVTRATAGKQTRSDVMMLSDTFVKLINMPDDAAIQKVANLIKSGNPSKPDVEEGNEFSGALKAARDSGEEEFEVGGKKYKVNECGHMDMGDMSPLTMMGADHEVHDHADMGIAKDRYTLSISKADGTTLNATTDAPDELAALMKAVGMGSNTAAVPAEPDAVEEEFGNTPAATNERDPRLHGHTKDWGLPGRGAGKPEYPGTRASGDNPMAESMFKEYLNFKSGK